MHPILARRGRLALYLTLWVLVGVLLALVFAVQSGSSWRFAAFVSLPLATVFGFVCLSAWYVARGMPFAVTGGFRIVAAGLMAAGISSAAWVAVARGWVALLSRRMGGADGTLTTGGMETLLFGFGVLLYLLSLATGYVFAAFEASQEVQRRGLQAKVLAREAELRSLRAQIDPHFLFNSLNSISALTTVDPAAARKMCVLLGDFLRDSLALGAEDRIPLARELSLVDRFLAIERIRLGDRLVSRINAGDASSVLVPPLLLQPIVENAVTHGVAHVLAGGTVEVEATRNGGHLRIIVKNPCDPDRPRGRGAGVGLSNVRARLKALHGPGAHLTASEAEGVWRVEIALPVEPDAAAQAAI
jgi:signal transduction histidine kinase